MREQEIAVINRLNEMARSDPFTEVRAAAAGALGMFILRGELGQLPETVSARLQETALMLYNDLDEDLEVRRRALEAIANCGREGVLDMIREAYYADDLLMRVSAVFAMGRTYDEMWTAQVLDELSSDYPEMRYEACRAAGELELRKAVGRLSELAYDDDREVQEMAIWALGEIGGKSARNILSQLAALAAEADDDELVDAIAEAQSAATLAGEDLLPLFDFSEYDGDLDDEEFASLESYDGFGDDEEDEDDEALLDEDDYVF